MEQVAYLQVYNTLKSKIISGEFSVGSLLPAEPSLEKMFRVSRITVRKAVEMLSQEGYIKAQRGIGTVVLNYQVTQNLNKITSMTETLKQNGYEVSIKDMKIDVIQADDNLAELLGVSAGTKVAQIFRVVCAAGMPMVIAKNYIPYTIVEGIEQYNNKFVSLYQFLNKQYFITFDMAQDVIIAKNADANDAKILSVKEGFALLCTKRKCLSLGQCICYDEVYARHDMYSFNISLYNR
jgi:GntR family transcriptional regulator